MVTPHTQILLSAEAPPDTQHQHQQTNNLTISTTTSSFSSHSSDPFSSPITPNQSWPEPSPQPSQQLIISLVGAKNLKLPPHSLLPPNQTLRPYAVLQFDHTESITNEAGTHTSNSNSPQKPGPRWRSARTLHRSNDNPSHSSGSPSRVCHLAQTTDPSDLQHPVWNHVAIFDVFKPRSSLFISIYHHHPSNPDHPAQEKTEQFLGGAVVDLRALMKAKSFDGNHDLTPQPFPPSSTQEPNSSFKSVILDDSIDLWNESGETKTGSILMKIEIKATTDPVPPLDVRDDKLSINHNSTAWIKKKKISMDDFEIIKLIGEGSYDRVRKKDTRRLYAMKTLEKSKITITEEEETKTRDNQEENNKIKLERVLTERKILERTRGCEFLVGLKFSFQTNENLNLIMDLKSGGELMSYMQRFGGRFDESWVVFYTAEILSGLKFLHSMNIAYRDLKVKSKKNCLLDATGHVALCDFGLSKLDMKLDSITKTFCGTTEYIAPELEQGYTRVVDFWSLGVLIFEMSVGWTPFFSENRVTRYSLILESDISTKFPKRGISDVTKNIILCLLEREPSRRLGSKGIQEIETHEFFTKLDWKALVRKRITPPFKPRVASDASLSYSSDAIYSYGGRSSNSVVLERNHVLSSPPTTTGRNNHHHNLSSTNVAAQFYSSSHQLSRRSSVEKHSSSASLFNRTIPSSDFTHHHHHLEHAISPALVTLGLDRKSSHHTHFRDFTFSRDTD